MTDADLHAIEIAGMLQDKAIRTQNKRLGVGKKEDFIAFPDLSGEELMKLCEAQVSEKGIAAYFGISVDELNYRLSQDDELKRIFDLGPDKGKAKIQVTQFNVAKSGDAATLQKFGENHLGQKNKVTHEMDDTQVRKWLAAAEAKLSQKEISDLRQRAKDKVELQYQDAEYEEVEDEA